VKPLTFFRLQTRKEVLGLYQKFSPLGQEEVQLIAAAGRITATPLVVPEDVPPFPRATMDGYAVRAQDTFGASPGLPQYLEIKGDVVMGKTPDRTVGPGEALRLPTGGMLPSGADAVVMVEYTAEHPDQTLEVHRAVAPGENILRPGEDVHQGEALFPAGHHLRPQDIGLLAALGVVGIAVHQRPLVAIISSGDEIVPVSQTPGPAQVRDSNAYLAAAQVEESGGLPRLWGIIPDDYQALKNALTGALREADLILISGGSSVGARDLTLQAIQDLPGADILVHGVAIRPGKPTILAAVSGKPLLGLPGHPASAAVVLHVLGRPLLARLAGLADAPDGLGGVVAARLSRNLSGASGREDFVRVSLRQEGDILWADPVLGPSGLLSPLVKSHGLVMIPLGVEGLNRDESVMVQLFK
jgi:molybdopterin molybdotransferase